MRHAARPLVNLLVLAAVTAGCVTTPPSSAPTPLPAPETVPAVAADTVLASDSVERQSREVTYRVRNLRCRGIGFGTAFAAGERMLVTNRHVVQADTRSLELTTWDGLDVSVDVAEVAVVDDLAVLRTTEPLPRFARLGTDPSAGAPVAVTGYPEAGPWTASSGEVVDYVEIEDSDGTHRVFRFNAPIDRGSSGGPVFDSDGTVVGVVFAVEATSEAFGLAIPVSVLSGLLNSESGGFVPAVPAC
jgi:S1-C subfamily serine protease